MRARADRACARIAPARSTAAAHRVDRARVRPSPALLVGLCVGSFLNVVIHRLPKMLERGWQAQCAELRGEDDRRRSPRYNLVVPRSACPSCGHRITALENIPVVSWLALARQVLGLQGADLGPLPDRRDPRAALLAAYAICRFGLDAPRASPRACCCGRCSR